MSDPKTNKSLTHEEAKARIGEAQKILEFEVQAGLLKVCGLLSRITHCPEWDSAVKLYDHVHAFWYELNNRALSPKIDLDPETAQKFLADLSAKKE